MAFFTKTIPRLLKNAGVGAGKVLSKNLHAAGTLGEVSRSSAAYKAAAAEVAAKVGKQVGSKAYRLSAVSALPQAKGLIFVGLGMKVANSLTKFTNRASSIGTPGIVGYGKRGIDANNLNTDGLVQGLSRNRRK